MLSSNVRFQGDKVKSNGALPLFSGAERRWEVLKGGGLFAFFIELLPFCDSWCLGFM
jgi:hypothetical protein